MAFKNVFITGISKGLGCEIALQLINEGYNVIGTSRNPDLITNKIPGVKYLQLELSDMNSIENCVIQLSDIDILIHNAGYSQLGALEETSISQYKQMYEVGLFGIIRLTQLILPSMRDRKSGRIVFIGSLAAQFPQPYYTSYSSVKAALKNLSYCLRAELKQFNIDVCIVEPSDLKTSLEPEFFYNEKSEYYQNAINIREQVRQNMQKAGDSAKIGLLIKDILKKKKLKPRYVVGKNAFIFSFLKRFVSDSFVEFVIMKMYNVKK